MKTRITLLLIILLVFMAEVKSQNSTSENKFDMKLNIKAGIGAALTNYTDVGITSFVTATAELPLTKNQRWNVNVGARFRNDNIFDYGQVKLADKAHYSAGRLEIPAIFSYDQPIYKNAFLRFNFGVYYSQLLFQTVEKEISPSNIHQFIFDSGVECGISFMLNNCYISLDYDILIDMVYTGPINNIRTGFGFRF